MKHSKSVRYIDYLFENDFLKAFSIRGEEINFSRQERNILLTLTAAQGRVVSRSALLNAANKNNLEADDRNIDYIVSRLRRKIGDPAKNSLYIGTQYGEGYYWKPKKTDNQLQFKNRLSVVIGPIEGLSSLGARRSELEGNIKEIADTLAKSLNYKTSIPICVSRSELDNHRLAPFTHAIEVSYMRRGANIDTVLRVKKQGSNISIMNLWRSFCLNDGIVSLIPMEEIALLIRHRIWRTSFDKKNAQRTASDPPLNVQIDDASRSIGQKLLEVNVSESLVKEFGSKKDPVRAAIEKASTIQTKHVRNILDNWTHDIQEIESILDNVADSVPNDSILLSAMAKLLFYCDNNNESLARDLVDKSFASGPTLAASYTVLGQIEMFCGNAELALSYFQQGIELSEVGSQFHEMLLILCSWTCVSVDRFDEARLFLEPMLDEGHLIVLQAHMILHQKGMPIDPLILRKTNDFSERELANEILYIYVIFVRLLKKRSQAKLILSGLIDIGKRIKGKGAIPQVLKDEYPELCE